MKTVKRGLIALAIAAAFGTGAAQAQVSDNVVKIGVLSDMSSLHTDIGGAGSVVAAKMAVEDSGIEKRGYKVEVVSADHQNKPDVGSAIAHLVEVKKPAESKGPWDYYKIRATIPADQAFRPMKDGDCPLAK